MPIIFEYILKLSISLAVVYIFYITALRRLTFYNCNRWYLLFYSMICFFIPFIDLSLWFGNAELETSTVIQAIPVFDLSSTPVFNAGSPQTAEGLTVSSWATILLFTGTLVLLIRLLVQYISFLHLKKTATLIHDDGVKIYKVEKDIIPFSLGNSIFLNSNMQNDEGLKEIIRHEFVHVKQKHSIDILFTEILCIINWYNPFAWMIRNAVRQNLEFIADNNVLQHGFDKKQYQYLLLKVVGVSQFSIAPKFNFSSLKKRIVMMNKLKSAKVHLFKFLFVLPLVAVLLLAFRESYSEKKSATVNELAALRDSIPPKRAAAGKFKLPDTLYWQKLNLPANVKKISIKDNLAMVTLKNGTIEKYDIHNATELASYKKKYGELPPPPPALPTEEMWKKAAGQNADLKEVPIYIVDGKEVLDTKSISPNEIEVLEVIKDAKAVAAYGEKGKNGVIKIRTKNGATAAVPEVIEVEGQPLIASSLNEVVVEGHPLKINGTIKEVIVDGRPTVKVTEPLTEVVVEGRPLKLTTKVTGVQLASPVKTTIKADVVVAGKQVTIADSPRVNVMLSKTVIGKEPLYILDGKEIPKIDDEQLKPVHIGSIQILSGKDAEAVYGEKGKNGVIIITTKKPPVS